MKIRHANWHHAANHLYNIKTGPNFVTDTQIIDIHLPQESTMNIKKRDKKKIIQFENVQLKSWPHDCPLKSSEFKTELK